MRQSVRILNIYGFIGIGYVCGPLEARNCVRVRDFPLYKGIRLITFYLASCDTGCGGNLEVSRKALSNGRKIFFVPGPGTGIGTDPDPEPEIRY
jgi:hypothetical protein